MSSPSRRLLSLAALAGVTWLLLADSASPTCEPVPFEGTYRVTSSCDELGSETIRLRSAAGQEEGNVFDLEAEHVDGDTIVTEASLFAQCSDDGDPAEYMSLTLEVSGAGGVEGGCDLALDPLPSSCSLDPSSPTSCTITLERVGDP